MFSFRSSKPVLAIEALSVLPENYVELRRTARLVHRDHRPSLDRGAIHDQAAVVLLLDARQDIADGAWRRLCP
jgi:hypothetical protein